MRLHKTTIADDAAPHKCSTANFCMHLCQAHMIHLDYLSERDIICEKVLHHSAFKEASTINEQSLAGAVRICMPLTPSVRPLYAAPIN